MGKAGTLVRQRDGRRVSPDQQRGAANFSGIEIWRGKHAGGAAKPLDPEAVKFFEQRVRPVLAENCYECHSSRAKNVGGQLLLDTRDRRIAGGESGQAIVPGDPEASLLVKAIRRMDERPHMPPKQKLPDGVIADLTKWIALGAPDPRDGAELLAAKQEALIEEGRQRRAFTPPVDSPLPRCAATNGQEPGSTASF